jgi:hypothetical protein
MQTTVIFANDSPELVFPPNTKTEIIQQQLQKMRDKHIESRINGGIDTNMYVHLHDVEYFVE